MLLAIEQAIVPEGRNFRSEFPLGVRVRTWLPATSVSRSARTDMLAAYLAPLGCPPSGLFSSSRRE